MCGEGWSFGVHTTLKDKVKHCQSLVVKKTNKKGRVAVTGRKDAMRASQAYPVEFGVQVAKQLVDADTRSTYGLTDRCCDLNVDWARAKLELVVQGL
eukprot:14656164-Alexandrium_andersonii.AAC.1